MLPARLIKVMDGNDNEDDKMMGCCHDMYEDISYFRSSSKAAKMMFRQKHIHKVAIKLQIMIPQKLVIT